MEPSKIDLRKHAPRGASKWTLVKYLIYLLCIGVLSWLIWLKSTQKPNLKSGEQIKEVKGVQIETN